MTFGRAVGESAKKNGCGRVKEGEGLSRKGIRIRDQNTGKINHN